MDPSRLFYQEKEVEKAWRRLTEAESIRDSSELELHRRTENTSFAERQRVLGDVMQLSQLAAQRQADEVVRGQRAARKEDEMHKKSIQKREAVRQEEKRRE